MSAICPICIFGVVINMFLFYYKFYLRKIFGKMDWVRAINVIFTKFWPFLRTFNAFNVDPNFHLVSYSSCLKNLSENRLFWFLNSITTPSLIDLVKNLIQYSNILNNKVIHLVAIVYSTGYFTITNGAT